ncbi:MAG: glycosyltransferase family 1 protein, partial [Dysgonamonadaceae bacterium]|nr:glycosyltransferase family 1 protein [Dysgonamonadaceae bacterium]
MKKYLNIVSFNIPFPASYGGVIDVFYKLKALHECGVKIILHTFEYGRAPADELNKYCEEVHYYQRRIGFNSQLTKLPYIVNSRRTKKLLVNLLKNDYPILFEGLHTCCYLDHPKLQDRLKMVRAHNIEHIYYKGLSRNSDTLPKKLYMFIESGRLK